MTFLLADSFTDALARLGNAEQKKVKTAVFDLQDNPTRPGLRLHKRGKIRIRSSGRRARSRSAQTYSSL